MKTLKLVICLLTIISISSCSSDDGGNTSGTANVIFTTNNIEYRFGNGQYIEGNGINTLDAREDVNNRISIAAPGTGSDISQIFITIDGITYFGDEGNATINSDTRFEGTFQGSYRNASNSTTITVTNGTFFVDK